jgi:DNA-binding GntR family transcriptional regulator
MASRVGPRGVASDSRVRLPDCSVMGGPTGDPDVQALAEHLRQANLLDPAELRELIPSLLILEGVAVRESPPFDTESIAALRAINRRLADSVAEPTAAALADDDFHRRLTAGCENRYLLEVVDLVRKALLDYERLYMLSPERLERSVAEHEAIVAALERGDHARAAELVRENFTTGMPEVEAQLRERSDD